MIVNGGTADEPRLPDEMYHDLSLHRPKGAYQTVFGLNVLPEYRRNGIATALVKAFIQLARQRKKREWCLPAKNISFPFMKAVDLKITGRRTPHTEALCGMI